MVVDSAQGRFAAPGQTLLTGSTVAVYRSNGDGQQADFTYRYQHVPHAGFANQRMGLTDNETDQVNLAHRIRFGWERAQLARVSRGHPPPHELRRRPPVPVRRRCR